MLLANAFDDFLGNACLLFIFIVWAIYWAISKVAAGISKVAQNPDVQEAAQVTFWSWLFGSHDNQ